MKVWGHAFFRSMYNKTKITCFNQEKASLSFNFTERATSWSSKKGQAPGCEKQARRAQAQTCPSGSTISQPSTDWLGTRFSYTRGRPFAWNWRNSWLVSRKLECHSHSHKRNENCSRHVQLLHEAWTQRYSRDRVLEGFFSPNLQVCFLQIHDL